MVYTGLDTVGTKAIAQTPKAVLAPLSALKRKGLAVHSGDDNHVHAADTDANKPKRSRDSEEEALPRRLSVGFTGNAGTLGVSVEHKVTSKK